MASDEQFYLREQGSTVGTVRSWGPCDTPASSNKNIAHTVSPVHPYGSPRMTREAVKPPGPTTQK
ncbi:hypothetical protein SXAG_00015 [Synechococcus phage S-CBS4]|nr:hypothetical protein SXAG_00015 [Synechococcus phage S-CBS4]